MDKKILIVVGILIIAVVAVGLYLHNDGKDTVDAELDSWNLYEEHDNAISLLDNRNVTPLDSLDDAKKGDTVMIGKAWSDSNLNQSVKEKINALAESGVKIITLDGNKEPFSVFMEKHSYEFEESAYINGVCLVGGVPCTVSMTVPTVAELDNWLGLWEKPISLVNYRNSTVDWKIISGALTVRSLCEDCTVMKSTQYLTDPADTDFILAVEECRIEQAHPGEGKIRVESLKQESSVTEPGYDKFLEFAPTSETYRNGTITMTAHGKVDVTNPQVCDSFSHIENIDKAFTVNYGIKEGSSDMQLQVYPSYIAETTGDMTVNSVTTLVLDFEDMNEKQRYGYSSVTCLKERA